MERVFGYGGRKMLTTDSSQQRSALPVNTVLGTESLPCYCVRIRYLFVRGTGFDNFTTG